MTPPTSENTQEKDMGFTMKVLLSLQLGESEWKDEHRSKSAKSGWTFYIKSVFCIAPQQTKLV